MKHMLTMLSLALVVVFFPLYTIWHVPVAETLDWTPLMATFWYAVGYFVPPTLYLPLNRMDFGPTEVLVGGIGTSGLYGILFASLYSLYILA